jgi:Golgi SNAP receptor complex protein 2
MEQLVLRETPAQREVWKRKILELRDDASQARRQGEHFDRIVNTNVRHQKERDELLTKRRQRKVGSSQEERDLTNLSDEAQSWQQSSYMVDGMLANGEAQLNSLLDQRQRLRGVTKFLGQIGDKLGISNSTMRIIERRDITDAYFVFGGMVVTMIVIYFVWL